MSARAKVGRSQVFRLVTIFSSGFGAASLSLWAMMLNRIGDPGMFGFSTMSAVIAGLAALAGAGCAHAYYIGSDETAKVYEEAIATDPTPGLFSRAGLKQEIAPLIERATGKARSIERISELLPEHNSEE